MKRRTFLTTTSLLATSLAAQAADPAKPGKPTSGKVVKTEEEWKQQLTELQFKVTRKHGTEPAFKNEYADNHAKGIYTCVCCSQELYSSEAKFESGTGWPSFFQPIAPEKIGTTVDKKLFYERTEVHCSRCDAHLGHVFKDAPATPTGMRYCMNSAAMKFIPAKAK